MLNDFSYALAAIERTDYTHSEEFVVEKQKIDTAVSKHEQISHQLPIEMRSIYMLQVENTARNILGKLDQLIKKGFSGQSLREVTDLSLKQLEFSMLQFERDHQKSIRIHETAQQALGNIDTDLQQLRISAPPVNSFKASSTPLWKKTFEIYAKKPLSSLPATHSTHSSIPANLKSVLTTELDGDEINTSACTPHERAKLQSSLLSAYSAGFGAITPLYQNGPCKREYARVAAGAALQKSLIPFTTLTKIQREIFIYFAKEAKNFCHKGSTQQQFCEKSAEIFKAAFEWAESQRPEKVKEFFQQYHRMVEKAADKFDKVYFVPKEVTKDGIGGLQTAAEQFALAGLFKMAAMHPKFLPSPTKNALTCDWGNFFLAGIFRDVGKQSKMLIARNEVLRLERMNLPLMLPPPKQTLRLTGRTVKNFQLLLEAPQNKRIYRHYKKNLEEALLVSCEELPQYKDAYFHATSISNAVNILKSRKIKRLDKGDNGFQGAFVATSPELYYGGVVFALNRSIETSSEVINAEYLKDKHSHWAGFVKAIPVTSTSLEYIALGEGLLLRSTLEDYAKFFSTIAQRKIVVESLKLIDELAIDRAEHYGVFVPKEWPLTMEFEIER